MRSPLGKNHIGNLESPVKGMDLGNWLGRARLLEDKLVNLLAWPDIEPGQQAKVQKLLHNLRTDIAVQLKRTV
jgi:hypothetical protein